jgi:hypothetical protein
LFVSGVPLFTGISQTAVSYRQRCSGWCLLGPILPVRWSQWKNSVCDRFRGVSSISRTPYVSVQTRVCCRIVLLLHVPPQSCSQGFEAFGSWMRHQNPTYYFGMVHLECNIITLISSLCIVHWLNRICFDCIGRYTQQSVVSAALRVVGNIVTGDDYQTQVWQLYNWFTLIDKVSEWQCGRLAVDSW